jgi:hypothetical protein
LELASHGDGRTSAEDVLERFRVSARKRRRQMQRRGGRMVRALGFGARFVK